MASQLRTYVEAMRDALRAGHAHYDLSSSGGTHRVKVGRLSRPGTFRGPFIWLSPGSVASTYDTELGRYQVAAICDFIGLTSPLQLDVEARVLEATDLLDDIVTALEAAHQDNGSALFSLDQLLVSETDALPGETLSLGSQFGVCAGEIRFVYRVDRGV